MTSFKTRRSYNIPNHAHFLTFSCYKRFPLLDADISKRWLIDSMQAMRTTQQVSLLAYVIMPEHAHLLIYTEHDRQKLETLLVVQGDRIVFRFWQAGGRYDKNVTGTDSLNQIAEYIHANPVRRGLVESPVAWRWSSARYWSGEEGAEMMMDR